MNRRRLDFEALRDALLFVAGNLDRAVGGRPVDLVKQPKVLEGGGFAAPTADQKPLSTRRTVYGFIDRQNLPGLLRIFDIADPDTVTAQRFDTAVPQQALFFMNSTFVMEQAASIVERAKVKQLAPGAARIGCLYQLIYQRDPSSQDVKLGLAFVENQAAAMGVEEKKLSPWERYVQVLLMSNEFIFVD
jgi:hypothetical protein